MKYVSTDHAPKAIGPYSQAVQIGNALYVSGQIPFDPLTMAVASTEVTGQTLQSLQNIKAIVEAGRFKITDIVKCTVYLKNMDQFSQMNAVYQEFFGEHRPARAAVEVARLPKDVLVEIDAICVKDN